MPAGSESYTHGHAESVLRSHVWRTVDNSAAYLAGHLRAGLEVLDVGCGPGTITVDLAQRVAPGRVVGIDTASEPLQQADATAAEAGAGNVTFALGDVYALDAEDDSFDVVHAHQVLQHLGEPVAALREMLRVCRPGGLVAARDADYAAMTWYPPDPRLDRWLEIYHAVARGNGGRARRRAQAAGVGPCRGSRRRDSRSVGVVPLRSRGPGLVGRDVGRTDRLLRSRAPGRRRRLRHHR